MGYDVERFVGEVVDNELLCQICASVLQDAVETPCEHFFCMECIKNWLLLKKDCPIDRQPLRKPQLRKPSRLLRNLLGRLEIKCDFEEYGCNMAVKLENLDNHRSICNNNPDTEITCNKGCDLPIRRRDLANNCLVHLKNRIHGQDEKISHLSTTVSEQRARRKDLMTDIAREQSMIVACEDEIEKLHKLVSPISKVRLLLNVDKDIFQISENLKTHHNQGILENEDKSHNGVAQLVHQLEPSNPSFSLCVLNIGPFIAMGLAGRESSGSAILDTSLVYLNDGAVLFRKQVIRTGEAWKEGDHISCNVNFPINGSNDLSSHNRNKEVSFYKNFKKIVTIPSVELPGYFPTVFIGSF
ncbi:E3 ubiquitin-protein ligase NRDP1-like [Bradysia coprophila]|uniref:E3 ubiquitin-protein ligase NRDP1-like n=1 Tax=Bradysia coprophila TaxID=38358 RepID=UPI00187DC2DD|nr:E3 ubiquitin-protein ligase NRDP1-like [Bradysia coprophila]